MSTSNFIPVRVTEEKLNQMEIKNGYLYFTVDTQKIFLGMPNGEKLAMGGSTGIYYGTKEIEYPTDGNPADPEVTFILGDEIEGTRLPLVNDLILNIDGCFYRVVEQLDETQVLTNRLTLRGSGSGGGSDDGAGAASLKINVFSSSNGYYSSGATSIPIKIIAFSSDKENYISSIECSYDREFNDIFLAKNVQVPLETNYELDLIDRKNDFNEYGKKVWVRITDKYGTVRSSSITIYIATLELTTKEDNILQAKTSELSYTCTTNGTNGITNKKIEYHFYDKENIELVEFYQYLEMDDSESGSKTKLLQVGNIPHGSYELKVVLTGTISGTLIESNELVHKLVCYDELVGQPIFTYLVPTVTEQYTDIPVQHLLTYGNESQTYNLDILVDEELLTTQVITTGTIDSYNFSFDRIGTYKITFQIAELNIDEDFSITVSKYTGVLPVINANDDSLKVYLTAKGRTNNNADKEYWPDYKTPTMRANLNDFYYRTINGWMIDEDNVNYLKVTQGASAELTDYTPFDIDPTVDGLTIELDFMLTGILDYDAHFIECLSYNTDGSIKTGFVVQGDKFKYYASNTELFSLNLVQNKRIRLSVVIESKDIKYPMCYAYLNGIISNAVNYASDADFTNNKLVDAKKAYLKFDSSGGEVNIYNIRIYNVAKEDSVILNNYQASLSSLEERQASYEENNIKNNSTKKITLEAIEAETYPLQIPYVKIVGGYKSSKDFTMSDKDSSNIQALPTAKKDFRAIDIEVIYPREDQNPYFKEYNNFSLKTTFENSNLNVLTGFGKTALTGAIMYAQGTSSLEYPVKNLRVKFKGDKIVVRPGLEPVDLVTFKADFMESSGSHNTGAANFIDTAYKYAGLSTPGQDYYEDEDIVTCIKGHPCVIFWSKTGEPGTFEYIGKYNLNLDKATPEPFGFKNDDDFGWEKDADGNFVLDEDGNKINSIYCFEFLDNNAKVCNFLSDEISNSNAELTTEQERYYDTWYSNREIDEDGTIGPGWRKGFESRHPEDKEGKNDADVLFPLASWLNELYSIYTAELAEGKKPTDIEYEYEYTKATSFNDKVIYYILNENNEYIIAYPNVDNFADDEYYTRKTISSTYAMTSIARFRDEYQRYLDPEFLLAYYIITEVLLMADSRVKNMMIATWGKEHRTFTKIDGTQESVYDYIWYPIFYDMDTMLGLDNAGYVNKNYYDEDTTEKVFNGDEVLWKFVRDALPTEINQFYNILEQANGILTKNAIIPFFNDNQADLANETFYNEDAIYKYINTFRNGYTDDLHGTEIAPGEGSRLYAAQGNRSMMREWFVENRIKYVRGKRSSINYQSSDRIEFRLTYPKYAESTDNSEEQAKINASVLAVPPSGDFTFTSLKTGFAGVKIGKNSTPTSKRFVDEQEQTISIDTTSGNGTETYLLGISNLSSVGDLSNKYLYKLVIGTDENNLKSLILGNHHKDYYNPFWGNEASIELTSFRFLEEFNLENCGTFKGSINFSNSPQIKSIKLNGSSTSSLILPVGGVLEELRIPTTVTNINIDSHPTLTTEDFTIGYYDYDLDKYVNNYSNLAKISIVGCPNIDTYSLICGATIKHPTVSNLQGFRIKDFNWVITEADDLTYDVATGSVSGIKILDDLSQEGRPIYDEINDTRATSLIGNIFVDVAGASVDEYEIYQKYHSVFPNVVITYSDDMTVDEAYTINFYSTESINTDSKPYYSVLSNGNTDLATLTSKNGPAGIQLSQPQKLSTNVHDYSFKNWLVVESADNNIPVNTKIMESDFSKITPQGDMKLVPEYSASLRLYEITLYDNDGTTILAQKNLAYDVDIGLAFDDEVSSYYNYKPYTGSKEDYRLEFKGWQTEYNFYNDPTTLSYTTLVGRKVVAKQKLYAYYKEENCKTTISNLEFFDIDTTKHTINIKDKYRIILQGKITLPSKDENGQYITKIINGNIQDDNNYLTHIYLLDDQQYNTIGTQAFTKYRALTTMELLERDTLVNIDSQAFSLCSKLKLSVLPKNLEKVDIGAFNVCPNVTVSEFGTQNSAPKLATLMYSCFNNSGTAVSTITIGYPGKTPRIAITNGAFSGYSDSSTKITVYVESISGTPELFGFTSSQIDQI